ncbi:MerR family transcriptional regulator [Oscillospiraceae bacterium HV4-5-C5C]|nr:MerR family transcriptional regulator [Oscillospiraceae bacterium HV4-5-C5C]
MDLGEVSSVTGLDKSTIAYYVDQKIVTPLYPHRRRADEAEYAQEDLSKLKACANLRRLELPLDQVREVLGSRESAAKILVDYYGVLKKRLENEQVRLGCLQHLDLGQFEDISEIIDTFAELKLDLPLPGRDTDHDADRERRLTFNKMRAELYELETIRQQLSRSKSRYFRLMLIFLFLFIACLGWIISPYLF